MLLVIVGGFLVYPRARPKEEAPSREFTELEFAGADDDHTGSCYSLSTVLIANRLVQQRVAHLDAPRDDAWTLMLDDVVQGNGGPVRVFQKFTFEKLRRHRCGSSSWKPPKDIDTDLERKHRRAAGGTERAQSTPVDRCLEPGATGYHFVPRR